MAILSDTSILSNQRGYLEDWAEKACEPPAFYVRVPDPLTVTILGMDRGSQVT